MPEDFITGYWGKARPLDATAPQWHPVAYHGLDVAAAGEAYLRLRPDILAALARRVDLPEAAVLNWLLLGLAIHDLGKFADCFQAKWRRLGTPPAWVEHPDPGHGSVGSALWAAGCRLDADPDVEGFARLFGERTGHVGLFRPWIDGIFGHHGRPIGQPDAPLPQLMTRKAANDACAFVEASACLFPLAAPAMTPRRKPAQFCDSSWLVAGTTMIADWIGSNQIWFRYERPTLGLPEYWPLARERAAHAIEQSGLSRPAPSPTFNLRDALALAADQSDPEPSDLQAWAADEFRPSGQSLIVIEDLTGAGKTEAALIAAHRLMQKHAAGGLYWALPTMATANGLYARLARSYRALFADARTASLVLAHGKREFNETFRESVLQAGRLEAPHGPAQDDESASTQCAAWIADDRRKSFLADVGVGTIDQALLAVLPAKHQALRLAALSQRVLVIDEVHSFDPYVSNLIATLLEFHASLGGSAILLSATMTQKLRSELTAAFAKGARWKAPAVMSNAFPLVTAVDQPHGVSQRARKSGRGTRRDLAVRRLEADADAIAVLTASYERGEASVWIRNTVHDAITAATLLRQRLGSDAVDLFHARFALGDRIGIETRALERFGRNQKLDRRRVLVATQVVEQSLDLDFDVMVSDLAPIDLLIQRAGRLHRHDRGSRSEPVLHVLGPDPLPDATARWFADMFPKGQYVYPDHGQLWLTMRHLLDAGGLRLFSASPRVPIETVYSGTPPDGLLGVWGKAAGEAAAKRGFATLNALKLSAGYAMSSGAWASDQITPTRLGAPQRTLRLATWDGAKLAPWCGDGDPLMAWRLSEVQVLAARVADPVIDDKGLKLAMRTTVSSWPETFDPPLLVPLREMDGAWQCEVIAAPRKGEAVGQRATIRYCSDLGLRFV